MPSGHRVVFGRLNSGDGCMSGTRGAPTPSDHAHVPDPMAGRRPSWPRWVLAALLVAAVAAFYALGLFRYFSWDYIRDHLDNLKASADAHRLTALLDFFLVYLTMAALSLPAAW